MASFNDLPDELLVKIFCSLEDHDESKIRLERVSQRFYSCLRESWKHSRCVLDFDLFDTFNGSAAFLHRVPEITHLRLIGPEHYEPEIIQQLYQNAHKMRVSKLEYQSRVERASNQCFTNAHLMVWCLSSFGKYLQTLDFKCCDGVSDCEDGYSEIWCKTLIALGHLLPSCRNLQHVNLCKIDQPKPSITDSEEEIFLALTELNNLKSLSLLDVSDFYFDNGGLVRVLNFLPDLESLSVVAEAKDRLHDNFLGKLAELHEGVGLELRSLTAPVFGLDGMQSVAIIQNLLPNLRNLTVNFNWEDFKKETEENDAKNLMEVIAEFITLGKRKEFEICFDLTVKRERENEYNFGEDFINRSLALPGARVKRSHDASKWEAKIVDGNVKVCIHTSINDLYAQRKEEN